MATVTLDKVQGAQLVAEGSLARRLVRTGKVTGMTVPTDPAETLLAVMAVSGVPAMLSALSSTYSTLVLTRMRIQPVGDREKHDFRLYMEYENAFSGLVPTVFTIHSGAHASTIETNLMLDGTKIQVPRFINPTIPAADDDEAEMPEDSPLMRFFAPVRALGFTTIRYGSPSYTNQDYVSYVNNAPWPSVGVPKAAGMWMLTEYDEIAQQYAGIVTIRGTAVTRNISDWSETVMLRSQKTGRYANVPDNLIQDMLALPYVPNTKYQIPPEVGGAARLCRNPWTNFTSLFGF